MNNYDQEKITKELGKKVLWSGDRVNQLYTESENLIEVLEYLKLLGFSFLADISAVDYQEYFEVVYQLCSFNDDRHLTVKVKLGHDHPQISSVCKLWRTADWLEREVYDLMGVEFLDHPNLKRILTWEGFQGHPLRKDYLSKGGRG